MKKFVQRFRREEDGAVTVDWVVLTAVLIGLTLGIIMMLQSAATDPADSLAAWLAAREV